MIEVEPTPRTGIRWNQSLPAIADYAVIGDCRTATLVSKSGSIDWLCLPDFSSPSIFAALLDADSGGRFSITPADKFSVSRRYAGLTPVLETTFTNLSGTARLTDLMPLGDPDGLQPAREILRVLEGVAGSVTFDIRFDPRPDYARRRVPIRQRGSCAFTCSSGNEHLLLRSDAPLERASDGTGVVGRIDVNAGDRLCFSLAYVARDVAVIVPMGGAAEERLQHTLDWWRRWARGCTYEGPHREAVLRSAVTLKLMTFALSGAVVAAPTTSLPEALGGSRNWDYRYCWLRDATLTMRAFLGLGLLDEAGAFMTWLLHATALTQPSLDVMYDVYGRTSLAEKALDHLHGYRGSRPVRIGNDAHDQLQLDVYGGVVAAAAEFAEAGGTLQPDQLKLLAGFGRTVCDQWREPDHGIWEIRDEKRHYTFSKIMCWLALDCLIRLSASAPLGIDRVTFAREREAIREAIERRAWNDGLGSYAGVLDGDWLDASLLLMSCLGYTRASDPRMRSTFQAIRERLGRDGLIYRYQHGRDGLESREGAFGICSFWVVDNLAMGGDREEAERLFADLLGRGNDLGLYSEEIDPDSGAALGNFPQAFTHVGLINAALALAKARPEEKP